MIPAPLQLPGCSREANLPGYKTSRVMPTAKASSWVPRALPRIPLRGPPWGKTLCLIGVGRGTRGESGELLFWPRFERRLVLCREANPFSGHGFFRVR